MVRERNHHNLTPEQRAALLAEYAGILQHSSGGQKCAGDVKALCERYGVSRSYPSKLVRRVQLAPDNGLEDAPRSGRPTAVTADIEEQIETFAESQGWEFTFAEVSSHVHVSSSAIWRWMKRRGWKESRTTSHPHLSAQQKQRRLDWAQEHSGTDWVDYVDVDEKWFVSKQLRRCVKIPPGQEPPSDFPQHKSHIPKVMFLSAVARPRPRHKFDGKIGIWRVAVTHTAQKKSKYHNAGDKYQKDATMDHGLFQKMMAQLVFPAIRKKMSFSKKVTVQVDGAKPHTGFNTIATLNSTGSTSTPRIEVVCQPAQSPDLNVNDLSFYRGLAAKVKREQRHKKLGDVEGLVKSVKKAWRKYPAKTLTKAFQTKTKVLDLIIANDGGNNFKIPHAKK